MEHLKHKGYIGSIEYSEEDNCLYGKVLGLNKILISYEGTTIQDLKKDFTSGIEDYLLDCKKKGTTPQKSFTGTFNVRVPSEIYAKAVLKAKENGISLNAFVRFILEEKLESKSIEMNGTLFKQRKLLK
jgi:predicted HicB family RNase H-like nuclease